MIARAHPRLRRRPPELSPQEAADKRYKLLEAAMKKHQYKPDALIEVLHKGQELFGFLSIGLLHHVATKLRLPPSKVYGAATFYNFFSFAPQGEHACIVCMGTACYVRGAGEILESLEAQAGIQPGQTTADGKLSLLTARCLGACGIAPAVVYDGAVAGSQTVASANSALKGWLENGSR